MNNKIIRYILSKILYIEAGFLLLPIIVSLIYKEDSINILSFLATIFLLLLSGFILGYKSDSNGEFYEKEGFIIVKIPLKGNFQWDFKHSSGMFLRACCSCMQLFLHWSCSRSRGSRSICSL